MASHVLTVELVAELLAKHAGNMAVVGKKCGVTRTSVKLFVDRHPELLEVIEDAKFSLVDHSVSAVHKGVRKGLKWAVERVLDSALGRGAGLSVVPEKPKEEPPKLIGVDMKEVFAGLAEVMRAAAIPPEKMLPAPEEEKPPEADGWKMYEEAS